MLVLPDYSKPFEVVCDASVTGTSAVLIQGGRPVANESKKLSSAEHKYNRRTGAVCCGSRYEDMALLPGGGGVHHGY